MLATIDRAAAQDHPLEVRFAVLARAMQGIDTIQAVCKRLKAPNECRDLAVMTARESETVGRAPRLSAEDIVTLCERCDAFRKPERFAQMLLAAAYTENGASDRHGAYLLTALGAARAVNAGEVAARHAERKDLIPGAVHAARVEAVAAMLHQTN